MEIAILILVGLSIFVSGTLTINRNTYKVNWFALIAFILLLIAKFS